MAKKNNDFFNEVAKADTVLGMQKILKKIANPDEIISKNKNGYDLLRKLENDTQVSTCIESRNAGITSLNWHLIDLDKKYEDFYTKVFSNIDIYEFMKSILKAPFYGFQPIEIMWEVKDGHILPKEVEAKPQEWFEYNAKRELCLKQKGNPDGLVITDDMKKFLNPRHNATYLNPFGKSVLARCFWDVVFKKGGIEFWLKFAEKYGIPFVIGEYEPGTSDDDIEKLLKGLQDMVQDAAAAIPNNGTIKLIEASGKSASSDLFENIIKYCDKNIAKNILGQTLTTDSDGKGSYALGKIHQEVRGDIITSDKRLVENTINIFLMWVHELNFNDGQAPKFELFEEEDVDKELAERDKILTDCGVKFTKSYWMKKYGLEEEDFELVENNSNFEFSEPESPSKTNKTPTNHVAAVDALVDEFSEQELEGLIAPKIEAIINEFSETQDIKQLEENLAILYPDLPSKEFEDKVAKTIFAAELWGRAQANEVDNA